MRRGAYSDALDPQVIKSKNNGFTLIVFPPRLKVLKFFSNLNVIIIMLQMLKKSFLIIRLDFEYT